MKNFGEVCNCRARNSERMCGEMLVEDSWALTDFWEVVRYCLIFVCVCRRIVLDLRMRQRKERFPEVYARTSSMY